MLSYVPRVMSDDLAPTQSILCIRLNPLEGTSLLKLGSQDTIKLRLGIKMCRSSDLQTLERKFQGAVGWNAPAHRNQLTKIQWPASTMLESLLRHTPPSLG